MDVLQLIKKFNRDNLAQIEQARVSNGPAIQKVWKPLKQSLLAQIMIERDYLYPEVQGVSKVAKTTVSQLEGTLAQLTEIVDKVSLFLKQADESSAHVALEQLAVGFQAHVLRQEDKLIPQIRQYMSTEEREGLSQVFQDALDDFIRTKEMECAV